MIISNVLRSSINQWVIAFIPTCYLWFLNPMESVLEENQLNRFLYSWISEPAKSIYSKFSAYFSIFNEPGPEPTFKELILEFLQENQVFMLSLFGEVVLIEVICYIYKSFIKVYLKNKQCSGEKTTTQS